MDDIIAACQSLPVRTFGAGDKIIEEGEPGGAIYILSKGEISVRKGAVEVARTSRAGALFGEMSALLNMPYSADVIARQEAQLFEATDGAAFLAGNPAVALHAARLLALRLYDSTAYLADLKVQFEDRKDHFAMVDRILDALMQQQPSGVKRREEAASDPRL